eukprot:CAMPEP_0114260004 /NCGR_PEP_ID=MMETSP0058-20121206/20213_1 /TAXON_ID=36894 /ORGANISM="Pyramimonas parkeae, CCMP726" /LENGTH=885 /DNA_ID=CAMNT_0001375125 /DNA_START=134 /DNA_END=2791 /DNA_ORIENTATION=+
MPPTEVSPVQEIGSESPRIATTTLKIPLVDVTSQANGSTSVASPMSNEILGLPMRVALSKLHAGTHFGTCELEMLLQQFNRRVVVGRRIDKATFIEEMGHAFGIADNEMMEHIFDACDETGEGTINFRHFVSCLSTIFRGTWEEVMDFWFRMYDTNRDGMLTKSEFEELLSDVSSHVVVHKVEESVRELGVFDDCPSLEGDDDNHGKQPMNCLSFEDFQMVMEEHHVLPSFAAPHQSSHDAQIEAYRDLSSAEREVLSMLGVEIKPEMGDTLIHEGKFSNYFFFIISGNVKLLRDNVLLSICGPGQFLGETAVFNDVKSMNKDGSVKFTTTATTATPDVVIVRMDIRDFFPLVFHEHPGATAIMQRLGEAVMQRLNQMEENLQQLLNQSETGNQNRLSRGDWDNVRKKLLHVWALRYHRIGRKGKLEITSTKNVGSAADLSIAYSPGVAEPCMAIKKDPTKVYEYTAKGHLVGVVTNGTAVLGLGNIGPLAAKPVMEGKAVLFKKFADLDAFDIELKQPDPEKLVDTIEALEPTFGGINLEDIKAPECFHVERECQRRMNIPVFHDDQHGTAIIAGAGLINALELVDKKPADVRVVVCGCGAAGFTCAIHFVRLGVLPENMICVDIKGVVYKGREDLDEENYLSRVAVDTPLRTLTEAISGADVFVGLSAGGLLKPDMLLSMNRDPLVFALANPIPEIEPKLARATREDVIMATGRSDYPNQINNVCAFPYMFRGALDCRASCINEEMKLAATMAIAQMAKEAVPVPEPTTPKSLSRSHSTNSLDKEEPGSGGKYLSQMPGLERRFSKSKISSSSCLMGGGDNQEEEVLKFGRDYIIPKPFDERLLIRVSSSVAKAAMDSGVARNPIDLDKYEEHLSDMMSLKPN